MNRFARQIVSFLTCCALLGLSACGGGGGGGGENAVTSNPSVGSFSGTVDFLNPGNGDWVGLFNTAGTGSRYQGLYRAADIGGSGYISTITFELARDVVSNECPDVSVSMAHTTLQNLGTTYASNIDRGTPVVVYQNARLSFPAASAGSPVVLNLVTPFEYNGVDNLVVDISTGNCTGAAYLKARAANPAYTGLIWNITDPAATTGSTWNAVASAKFGFFGGTKKLAMPAASSGSPYPFDYSSANTLRKVQMLYSADLIDGSGGIRGVGFPINVTNASEQVYTVSIKMGHSTRTDLGAVYADNFSDTPVTLASDLTLRIPAGALAGETIWLPVNGADFTYNGNDNLIVEIEVTDVSNATADIFWTTRSGNANMVRLVGTNGASAGILNNTFHDIALLFHGASLMITAPNAGSSVNVPFSNSRPHRVQYFYNASQVGVDGVITELSFRAASTWTISEATLDDLEIVIGQNDNAAPANALADNLLDPVVVHSGSFTISDTVDRGDWIVIPLATSYPLDNTRNLVIQTSLPLGSTAGGKFIMTNQNSARFPLYIGGGLADPDTVTNITVSSSSQADIRLLIE